MFNSVLLILCKLQTTLYIFANKAQRCLRFLDNTNCADLKQCPTYLSSRQIGAENQGNEFGFGLLFVYIAFRFFFLRWDV